MNDRQPLAFLSYVRSDDEHDGGRITTFRQRLEGEVKMHTGKAFPIFQDRNDLSWGQHWKTRIKQSISEVTFLIPIVTPSFFESPACRDEFTAFLLKEEALGENRLILPIYYLTCDQISSEYPVGNDPIADVIRQRQWTDWRPFRFKPYQDEKVAEALAALAVAIKGSIREIGALFDLADEKAKAKLEAVTPEPLVQTRRHQVKKEPTGSGSKTRRRLTSTPLTRELIEPHEIRAAILKGSMPEGAQTKDRDTYRVYTKHYDEIVDAAQLCAPEDLLRYFNDVVEIAADLKEKNRDYIEKFENFMRKTAISKRNVGFYLLVDNSGSLRTGIDSIAAWSLIIAESLERSGVRAEVAGHTTRAWKGGRARELWVKDKRPRNPGRLNDLRYVIYKPMQESIIDSAANFGAMLHDGLLKENIDGEALLWAYDRLMASKSDANVILVLTDGAPVDDSTLSVNRADFLEKHLKRVASWIERQPDVALCAVGIRTNPSRYYQSSLSTSGFDAVGLQAFRLLETIPLLQS